MSINMLALVCLCIIAVSANSLSRIVNGQNAVQGAHPHQVSLKRSGSHSCGGAIVNENWIVTAAHCTQESSSLYSIVINEYRRSTTDLNEETISVAQVVNHPSYGSGSGSYPNDISLLRLSRPISVPFTSIALATAGDTGSSTCTITGWGRLSGTSSSLPDILQKTTGQIMSTSVCRSYWPTQVSDNHICILGDSQSGACNGDSGGPMECVRSDGVTILAGVTSFGMASCSTSYPSVYTRISAYNTWINSIVN